MSYTLLHDPHNAASVAFLQEFGASGPVLSGVDAVSYLPTLQGYPTVVYADARGNKHALFNPATMAAVDTWRQGIDNPASPVKSTVLSKYAFLTRFTLQELAAALAAVGSDIMLQVGQKLLDAAQEVDLTDQNIQTYVGLLVTKNALTQSRADAILTP